MNVYDDEELEKKESEEVEIGEVEEDDGEIVEESFDDMDSI
jgi:hypothetical protein